jgi:DNA polymerase bacteriophage-type
VEIRVLVEFVRKRITLDFETRSMADLKKVGAYRYSLDPTTQPTCLAFKVHDGKEFFLDLKEINQPWSDNKPGLIFLIFLKFIREGFLFSAHNAFFERCIYTNILVKRYHWPEIPVRSWRCTAAKAAACALPRNLEGAGLAMKLFTQKDRRGYAAMMATCKPTKEWKRWKENGSIEKEPRMFLEPDTHPDVFRTLYEYCKIDVRAEEELDDAIPDLTSEEQEVWFLNQEINWRGLRVDLPLVEKIVSLMAIESKKKLRRLEKLTMGLVGSANARNSILEFLELEGVKLSNLRAETVEKRLSDFDLSANTRGILEIRKALSKASTKKYETFLNRAGADCRVRDIVLYHGASTGRDTGTGIQPHNFPRGVVPVDPGRPYAHVENVRDCDYEMLQLLYGESLSLVFSSILRNMIIPTEGCELWVADFSQIEVAVLWWLAGNKRGLKLLTDGEDVYVDQAVSNTGKRPEEISFDERQLGKGQVLGGGFGMGWKKFQETAAKPPYNLKLSDDQAQAAIANYRRLNPAVPALWKEYENVAIQAMEAPGTIMRSTGRADFRLEDKFLWVTLPSGRRLAYREPQITYRETEYGPRKTLEFWAVNSKTKKWGLERTWGGTLTENIVQAVARDLMMAAILRLERAGYRALLTVHDEALCERKLDEGNLREFENVMTESPPWCAGLPIRAKAWRGPRYRK